MVQQIGVRSPFFVSPGGLTGKESACNVGDLVLFPGLGRSPVEGIGYLLQYSGLENSVDCIVHGVAKSWARLSNFHFHMYINLWILKHILHSRFLLLMVAVVYKAM